ncbi:unnamed protein product [Lactuca saligna]|uniref:Uncharacterized protein n=1 Tax=Lactuca saligna TaxID=75948 RepID=A0AA35YVL0_LACSI|nr:unnamed protein product [Lactuca saligna]
MVTGSCPSASPFSSLFLCKKSSSSWDANYLGPAKTVRITDITFQLEGNGIERSFEQVQSRLSSDVVLHTRLHPRFRSKTTPKSGGIVHEKGPLPQDCDSDGAYQAVIRLFLSNEDEIHLTMQGNGIP